MPDGRADGPAGGTDDPEPVVDGLEEVWLSFAAACEDLDPDGWDRPTDCPGWTVRDQLSHVIGVERMVLGDEAPPPPAVVPGHVRNGFAALNEAWVDARRDVPGSSVLDEFVSVTGRRLRELRALPAGRFDELTWGPTGEVTYRGFLESRILDSWVHEQDVRRALGRPGGRNGAGESAVLDRCAATMAYVVGKRVAPPGGTSVAFEVTGPLGRRVPVVVADGRATVVDGGGPDVATTTLTMDAQTFWRLGFGRVGGREALAAGDVLVEGDGPLARQVLDAMAFMV